MSDNWRLAGTLRKVEFNGYNQYGFRQRSPKLLLVQDIQIIKATFRDERSLLNRKIHYSISHTRPEPCEAS